jgi:serine/threonine protein kinase
VRFLTWKKYPCLVMEFVQGVTLDCLYRDPQDQSFKINRNWSRNSTYYLQIFLEISRGMSFLWEEKKLLHLDLKPSNIIIDERDAIPKILDFGLSRTLYVYQDSPLEQSLTDLETPLVSENRTFATFINETQGQSIYKVGGTLAYMAPEQFKGLHYCDTRTDIYGMGVLMYEVITGKRPFQPQPGEPLLYTYRQLHEKAEIGEIPGCDPVLAKMIYKCLEKSPEKRFNSFKQLFENLNNLYFQETGRYYPMEVVESPDPDILENRASLQLNFGNYQKGLSLVEQAIALDPNHLPAQITKVSALCQLHLLKEAQELIEDILKRHPDHILALNQGGIVYYALEMYDRALQCFEKVIFINSENNEFNRGNLAYTLLQIANENIFSEANLKKRIYLDRARKELETGLKENPESEYLLSILVQLTQV